MGQVTSYSDGLEPNGLEGARLGILRSFFGRETEHHEVTRVVENSIAAMRRHGAVPVELGEPDNLVELDADELITKVSVSRFELDAHLSSYLARRGAPFPSLGDIVASGKYEPALKGLYEGALARSMDEPDYERRLRERLALRERVMQIMAAYRLDAIVYPHQKRLVVPIGEDQKDRNGVLGAVTGFPAITGARGILERDPERTPGSARRHRVSRTTLYRGRFDPAGLCVRAGDAVPSSAGEHAAAHRQQIARVYEDPRSRHMHYGGRDRIGTLDGVGRHLGERVRGRGRPGDLSLVAVWSKNSCGFPVVVSEQSTEPFPTANRGFGPMCLFDGGEQQ